MKKRYVILILIICTSFLYPFSGQKTVLGACMPLSSIEDKGISEKMVDNNYWTAEGDNTVFYNYKNTIEISQDFASIMLEYLPEQCKNENMVILLVNCNNGNITQKKYSNDNLLFENLSGGTYAIQVYNSINKECMDLSPYISICYDANMGSSGFKGI